MRLKSEKLALCREVMRSTQTHLRADGCAKENRSSADGAAETENDSLVWTNRVNRVRLTGERSSVTLQGLYVVEQVRRRHCRPSATTVTGWKQQEKQCDGRAAAALTAAAVAACKQSREWVRGGTKTHRRVIHGKRCSREGAVSTFNAGGGGGGRAG